MRMIKTAAKLDNIMEYKILNKEKLRKDHGDIGEIT